MKKLNGIIGFLWALTLLLMSEGSIYAQKKTLIIPVEINSVAFSCERTSMEEMLKKAGDYYSILEGRYSSSFELAPTITITSATYTSETASMAALEAYKACSKKINMSDYADNFGIIFSGSDIWPHEKSIRGTGLRYFAVSEIFESLNLPLGPFCHEYAHLLGLNDLYDTDGEKSGGESIGLWGSISLMDKGDRNDECRTPCMLSAVERHLLGLSGKVDTLKTEHYELKPATQAGAYYLLPTDKTDEYFLFECRAQEGWDSFIGGKGLLVYHIDRSSNKAGYSTYYDKILSAAQRWEYNQVNCRVDHPCAMLLEAFPGAENISEVFFPHKEGQTLSSESTPSLRSWSGMGNKLALKNISLEENGSVSFDVLEPIKETAITAFQDAAQLSWSVDESLAKDFVSYELYLENDGEQVASIIPGEKIDEENNINIYLTALQENTSYTAELLVHFKDEDFSLISHFKTMVIDERNTIPFIFIMGVPKNDDGSYPKGTSIPLYVYNSYTAKEINWTFNGKKITPDAKGRYTLTESGVLRAELLFDDSTSDVICKEITIR